MKTKVFLFVILCVLLLAGISRAQSQTASSSNGLGTQFTSTYATWWSHPRNVVFKTADCIVTAVNIENDSLSCEFKGRWTSVPFTPANTTQNAFFLDRGSNIPKSVWEDASEKLRRSKGKHVAISIEVGGYVIRGGIPILRLEDITQFSVEALETKK